MAAAHSVTVKILDKEYQVACPKDQEAELIVSANYLDSQMRAIRDSGKVVGLERIAVMAALNISYELLRASRAEGEEAPGHADASAPRGAVEDLNRKLDEALYKLRQIEIG